MESQPGISWHQDKRMWALAIIESGCVLVSMGLTNPIGMSLGLLLWTFIRGVIAGFLVWAMWMVASNLDIKRFVSKPRSLVFKAGAMTFVVLIPLVIYGATTKERVAVVGYVNGYASIEGGWFKGSIYNGTASPINGVVVFIGVQDKSGKVVVQPQSFEKVIGIAPRSSSKLYIYKGFPLRKSGYPTWEEDQCTWGIASSYRLVSKIEYWLNKKKFDGHDPLDALLVATQNRDTQRKDDFDQFGLPDGLLPKTTETNITDPKLIEHREGASLIQPKRKGAGTRSRNSHPAVPAKP